MSRPVRPSRRPRLLVVVLGALLVLGACAGQRQIPDQYGDTTRDNFQEGCEEALTVTTDDLDDSEFVAEDIGDSQPFTAERAQAVCRCSYEGISGPDGIPFEEFKDINDAFEEDPGPLPEDVQAIVTGCVDDNPA